MYDVLMHQDSYEITANGSDLEVSVRLTIEGSVLILRQKGCKGMRNIKQEELRIDLTAEGHATLVAAMQTANRFHRHKKIKA